MRDGDQQKDVLAQNPESPMGPPPRRGPMPPYKFSPDELRVLQECNTESMYQRSIPIGITLGTATLFGVRSGYLRGSVKYGALPKVLAAGVFGYILGKFSYQTKCAEKFMQLPDSNLGKMLRQRRNNQDPLGSVSSGFSTSLSMLGASPSEVYSDSDQTSSLNLDTDRPTFADLDETPSDGSPSSLDNLAPKAPSVSYEELRSRNRTNHTATQSQPYKLDEPTLPIVRSRPHVEPKNQYGDPIIK